MRCQPSCMPNATGYIRSGKVCSVTNNHANKNNLLHFLMALILNKIFSFCLNPLSAIHSLIFLQVCFALLLSCSLAFHLSCAHPSTIFPHLLHNFQLMLHDIQYKCPFCSDSLYYFVVVYMAHHLISRIFL